MPRKASHTQAKFVGRAPDYDLKAFNKRTEQTTYVGAGWKKDDGSITIKIDLCVVLNSNPELILTLFPYSPEERRTEENRWPKENPST